MYFGSLIAKRCEAETRWEELLSIESFHKSCSDILNFFQFYRKRVYSFLVVSVLAASVSL